MPHASYPRFLGDEKGGRGGKGDFVLLTSSKKEVSPASRSSHRVGKGGEEEVSCVRLCPEAPRGRRTNNWRFDCDLTIGEGTRKGEGKGGKMRHFTDLLLGEPSAQGGKGERGKVLATLRMVRLDAKVKKKGGDDQHTYVAMQTEGRKRNKRLYFFSTSRQREEGKRGRKRNPARVNYTYFD